MFEDTPEIVFNEINADRLAGGLTYLICDGELSPNAPKINWLLKSAIGEYQKQLIADGKSGKFITRANTYGGDHLVEKVADAKQLDDKLSRAELFLLAADSLFFGKRYSDSPIEYSIPGETGSVRYSDLESGDSELRNGVTKATIKFAGEDNKFNGTTVQLTNGTITIFERQQGRDIPVLIFQRGKTEDKSSVTVFKGTAEGERMMMSVSGRDVFNDIRDGLLFGDLYPHSQSVTSYMVRLNEPQPMDRDVPEE